MSGAERRLQAEQVLATGRAVSAVWGACRGSAKGRQPRSQPRPLFCRKLPLVFRLFPHFCRSTCSPGTAKTAQPRASRGPRLVFHFRLAPSRDQRERRPDGNSPFSRLQRHDGLRLVRRWRTPTLSRLSQQGLRPICEHRRTPIRRVRSAYGRARGDPADLVADRLQCPWTAVVQPVAQLRNEGIAT
jgi:hypothetical protein